MSQSISYDKYRQHMLELSHKKQQLNKIIESKKVSFREYRLAYKAYREFAIRQDKITTEILKLLPDQV
jgi:hypothetical protein